MDKEKEESNQAKEAFEKWLDTLPPWTAEEIRQEAIDSLYDPNRKQKKPLKILKNEKKE